MEDISSRKIGSRNRQGGSGRFVADYSEPIATMLLTSGKVRNVSDQAVDKGYKDEYCCEVIANGKWLGANPKTAAATTRALLKGAKYVRANPVAAAEMSVK